MLIDQHDIRALLRQIVQNLCTHTAQLDDLVQEMMVHLWQEERDNPGQTKSWYLQSCRFHALDYLKRGRSLDCGAHRDAFRDREIALCHSSDTRFESPFESASMHDLTVQLVQRLPPVERSILGYLADECNPCEIANKLGISHQAVRQHRKHIAHVAVRLGLTP